MFVFGPETWVTSDHHFGHDNIIKLCNRPQNHEELMAFQWREKVMPDDVVLHLGDLAYKGNRARTFEIIRSLPGTKFLVRGNHDHQRDEWYAKAGFTILEPFYGYCSWINKTVYFSHRPEVLLDGWSYNVHGHIHNHRYESHIVDQDKRRNVSVEMTEYAPVRLKDILV